jgi:hypothetical protein
LVETSTDGSIRHYKFNGSPTEAIEAALEYSSVDDIPRLISPTEHGWENKNVKESRRRKPGKAQLVITFKNRKPEISEGVSVMSTVVSLYYLNLL